MNRKLLTIVASLMFSFLIVIAPVIPISSANTTMVCFGQPYPSGYIRTNFSFTYNCGNPSYPIYPNTSHLESYFDKPGGVTMDVCNDNFIPANWVLTETIWRSTQCGGSPAAKNVARIRAVAPSDTTLDICAQSPIPPGWHFVREYQSITGCGGLFSPYHLRWVIAKDTSTRKVHVVYLVPADKPVRMEYQIAIGNAILHLQNFYQSKMDESRLVSGVSFTTNSPIVEVYRTSHISSYYSSSTTNINDFWNKALADGFALSGGSFNDPNNRWIYYIDADQGCVNGNGQSVGGTSGVALLPANDLRGITRQQTIGLCGQTADGSGPCRWIGGLGHELGHAFGLSHPPGCDQGNCSGGTVAQNSLMYLGYTSYPNTTLLPANVTQLFGTGFFTFLTLDGPRFNCSANAIDDSRVFVRVQYLDFLQREPDQSGWNYWTGNITLCGTDSACTGNQRVNTSKAFWYSPEFLAGHPGLRNPSGVTPDFNNAEFIRLCYLIYLLRDPTAPPAFDLSGYNYWLSELNRDTANDPGPNGYNRVISAFLTSAEYRLRFGQ